MRWLLLFSLLPVAPLRADYLLLSGQTNAAGNASSSTSFLLHDALGSPSSGLSSSPSFLLSPAIPHLSPRSFLPGDVNGDGSVNPLDIQFLSQYLYFHGPSPNPLSRADLNHDLLVNDLDLVFLSLQILHPSLPLNPPAKPLPAPAKIQHKRPLR